MGPTVGDYVLVRGGSVLHRWGARCEVSQRLSDQPVALARVMSWHEVQRLRGVHGWHPSRVWVEHGAERWPLCPECD